MSSPFPASPPRFSMYSQMWRGGPGQAQRGVVPEMFPNPALLLSLAL